MICPVLPAPLGGGEKRTLRLIEAMENAGAVPHLITDDPGTPEALDGLRDRGWAVDVVSRVLPTPLSRVGQHLARLPSPYLTPVARRLRELVAEGCAFVQFEHTQSAYYPAIVVSAPWVLSLHNIDSQVLRTIARDTRPLTPAWGQAWNRWHAMRTVERRRIPQADAVLCVSESDRGHLAATARRTVLVANGVDDDLFEIDPRLPNNEDVLFFGRLDYAPNEHGLARFLRESWPAVSAQRPAARLRVVGTGLSPQLARILDVTPGAEAVGFVPNLHDELSHARLVVTPLWQGGGTRLKVLESLAAARPVVGTSFSVEGIGFKDGAHGLLGDSPATLARACVDLLRDAPRAGAMARDGRCLAENFRWRHLMADAESLYATWLSHD